MFFKYEMRIWTRIMCMMTLKSSKGHFLIIKFHYRNPIELHSFDMTLQCPHIHFIKTRFLQRGYNWHFLKYRRVNPQCSILMNFHDDKWVPDNKRPLNMQSLIRANFYCQNWVSYTSKPPIMQFEVQGFKLTFKKSTCTLNAHL